MISSGPKRRIRLRDDAQQWELDRAINETGRVQHFFSDSRKLPKGVKSHAMISKHLGKPARRLERLGDSELAAGHDRTALELYIDAAMAYAEAQHPIFKNNAEKRLLHAGVLRCYERVRELAPNRIDRIEVPWGSATLAGYLHHARTDGPAPLVVFIPGCDMTKEMAPNPLRNWATDRGMHLLVLDGPGQGECNLAGVKLTVDNYEDAISTALTHVLERREIDAERVGLFSMSFGSYWGARVAATDDRYKANVLQWASVCDKRHQFDGGVSPRYKQLFAYLTQTGSEEELDAYIEQMDLTDMLPQVTCPTLMTVGEFDPRSPLDETLEVFDLLTSPKEGWVFGDQQHVLSLRGSGGPVAGAVDSHQIAMDWLHDRLMDKPLVHDGEVLYIEPGGVSPNDPSVARRRHWFE